jgi:hypothetical protein
MTTRRRTRRNATCTQIGYKAMRREDEKVHAQLSKLIRSVKTLTAAVKRKVARKPAKRR